MTNGTVARLRTFVIVLAMVVIFAAFAAPITVIWVQNTTSNNSQLAVTCEIRASQIVTLMALEQIRDELGLPGDLPLPKVPIECLDS